MNQPPELMQLIEALSDPAAHHGGPVEVHQTHISVVFVVGDRAYKLKKPVNFGFVDYSTAARRRAFCEAEVRLNRRLAPGLYLGIRSVVPVDGTWRLGPEDAENAVDWVVEMQRVSDADRFLAHLHNGTLEAGWLTELGNEMAAFHASCEGTGSGSHGAFETVARNARENFSQSTSQIAHTVDEQVFVGARAATEEALGELEQLIRSRDETGHTRDTHGDLRLEHVYRIRGELLVVDCVEFNDAFRCADPVSDIAFLVMDLRIRWAADLADAFCEAYFGAMPGGERLLDFYVAYRSAVRAKVHGMAATEPELDDATRERAVVKSRAHWLFTWGTLARPERRPALVLAAGLPGTGKSTLARSLVDAAGFTVIDSDEVRKELAGVPSNQSMRSAIDGGIYTTEWTQRTYDECLRRTTAALFRGERVVVAAGFRDAKWRDAFLAASHAYGVPGLIFVCDVARPVALERIAARSGDASDANAAVYEHLADAWEEPSGAFASRARTIHTLDREASLRDAMFELRRRALL